MTRSQPPTAKRTQRARAQGDIGYSAPLTYAAAVAVALGWVVWSGARWAARWRAGVAEALTGSGADTADAAAWEAWWGWIVWEGAALVGVVAAAGALVAAAQVGGVVRARRSERAGWAQGLARMLAWGAVAAVGGWGALEATRRAEGWDASATWADWTDWTAWAGRVGAAALAVGVADAALGRWLRWRRLHMTTAEVRAEAQEGEASPALRQRLREGARGGGAQGERPEATAWQWVVVALIDLGGERALCLSYAPPWIDPPHVARVAEGAAQAAALVWEAQAQGVPVVEEPPLVRQLAGVAAGQPIPKALFDAVGRLLGALRVAAQG